MNGGRWRGIAVMLAGLMLCGAAAAANIKNFIESARRAPVVYVGVVRRVTIVGRDAITAWARAEVDVKAVGRGGEPPAAGAGLTYFTQAEGMLPMDGPPQYVLRPGTWVFAFANDWDGADGVRYLRSGTRAQVAELVTAFAESTPKITGDALAFNEITEDQRDAQAAMYRALAERLDALP